MAVSEEGKPAVADFSEKTDRIFIANGGVGPLTKWLQKEYMDLVRGERLDPHGWRSPVNQPKRVSVR